MQKVVGSSPIIRFLAPRRGFLFAGSFDAGRTDGRRERCRPSATRPPRGSWHLTLEGNGGKLELPVPPGGRERCRR